MAAKLYEINLDESGYTSPHSLIRECFNSPYNICPSYINGSTLYLVSKIPPLNIRGLVSTSSLEVPPTENVSIKINLCLDTRHAGKKNRAKGWVGSFERPTQSEALKLFCERAGLEPLNFRCELMRPIYVKKFVINNIFKISGVFKIVDNSLFESALINGLGTRKSYGFGLILTGAEEIV